MSKLEDMGRTFYSARSLLKQRFNIGLTSLTAKVHDRSVQDKEITEYRDLLAQLDRAVLEQYGWGDIIPVYESIGDYDNEDGSPGAVRLNFTEEVCIEIMRRLLSIHSERFKTEQAVFPAARVINTKAKKSKKSKDFPGPELFDL
jgi:hypothetical protein